MTKVARILRLTVVKDDTILSPVMKTPTNGESVGRKKLGTKTCQLRLHPRHVDWLDRQAAKRTKDRSAFLRDLIDDFIDEEEGDEAAHASVPPQNSGVVDSDPGKEADVA